MFRRCVLLLCLAAAVLAEFQVSDEKICKDGQKYITKVGSPVINQCNVINLFGQLVRKNKVLGCLAYDEETIIPVNQTINHYHGAYKISGFRISCTEAVKGKITMKTEACLMNGKVVAFGAKGNVGHNECTCEEKPYSIKCKPMEKLD